MLANFWKTEACGQTVLADMSILIGQKLVEIAKIENFNCDIFVDFQTLCEEETSNFSGTLQVQNYLDLQIRWRSKQALNRSPNFST